MKIKTFLFFFVFPRMDKKSAMAKIGDLIEQKSNYRHCGGNWGYLSFDVLQLLPRGDIA